VGLKIQNVFHITACHQLTYGELSAAFPAGLRARSRKLAQVDLDLCVMTLQKNLSEISQKIH
jgi:hypothetical protein